MQPESSDGLASVGTILPEEGAALLPGGSFRFMALPGRSVEGAEDSSLLVRNSTHIPSPLRSIQARFIQFAAAFLRRILIQSGISPEFGNPA
jgi:hypothetical protein